MVSRKKAHQQKKSSSWRGYAGAIALVLGIHIFFYQPFTIPSGSMIPTLLVGDYLFVNKFAYGFSRYSVFFQPKFIRGRIKLGAPKRGEVAVFFHNWGPGENPERYDHGGIFNGAIQRGWRQVRNCLQIPSEGVNYVKRVIGLPGDKIQMREGVLYINDEPVKVEYKKEYTYEEGGHVFVTKWFKETLPNGKEHAILKMVDFGLAPLDNTKEFVVPDKCYFMMGDNRDNSMDSREFSMVGFVPEERLVGRPDLIFFSTEARWYEIHKWLFTLRWDRFFKLVK